MKPTPSSHFFSMVAIFVMVSLACKASTPTAVPPTRTPAPKRTPAPSPTSIPEISDAPTITPLAADPQPTPTATLEPAPVVLSYVQLGAGGGGLADFSGVRLEFDLLSPGVLYAKGQDEFATDYQSTDGGATWQKVAPDDELLEKRIREAGIIAVRRDPHSPTTLYGFNEAAASFVKSLDEGTTWTPFATPFDVMTFMYQDGILEFDPKNPGVLFASDITGVYKSADGGEAWREIMAGIPRPIPSTFSKQRFIFDSTQPDTVYFLDGGIHGLYRSVNGGELWQQIELPRDENNYYQAITWVALDPQNSNILYAASNTARLFKSADGGKTWQADRLGLAGEAVIQSLAINPTNPNEWYAILQEGAGKLYKSEDSGQAWNPVQTGGSGEIPIQQLAVDAQNRGVLYATSNPWDISGLFRSADGGVSWSPLVLPQPDDPLYSDGSIVFWAIDPQTPTTLYVGLTGAGAPTPTYVYKTTDAGETWTQIYSEYSLYDLVLAPSAPANLFLIKNPGFSGGTDSRVVKSADGGQTWQEMGRLPALYQNYSDWLAPDPQNPNLLYLYVQSQGILKSSSAGGSWQPANAALPEGRTVDRLLIDPQDSTTFYAVMTEAATGMSTVFKSADGGQTWNPANSGLPDGRVPAIVLDSTRPATLYAAVSGFGVFRSVNGGESWAAVNPQPFSIAINSLVMDPFTPNTLYAGTAKGVWIIQP